jgi:GrpB-like predicted nucleotidyltransferase (UPF0157 family)
MYLFSHNINWRNEYIIEKDAVLRAFGQGLTLHHIGSTAVAGLYAKDCIDMLGVVSDMATVSSKMDALIKLAYVYKGEYGVAGRAYFSKANRKVHLHIVEQGHAEIFKHLHFVKVMCQRPDLVEKLNQLKQQLHTKYPKDKDAYQVEKSIFYDEINAMP